MGASMTRVSCQRGEVLVVRSVADNGYEATVRSAKTADVVDSCGSNSPRVDRVQLVCLACIRELVEEVRAAIAAEALETLVEIPEKSPSAVETVVTGPAAEILVPRLPRSCPLIAPVVKPAFWIGRSKPFEAPVRGRFVEDLPIPFHHDHGSGRG